jgi:hypothetical protein
VRLDYETRVVCMAGFFVGVGVCVWGGGGVGGGTGLPPPHFAEPSLGTPASGRTAAIWPPSAVAGLGAADGYVARTWRREIAVRGTQCAFGGGPGREPVWLTS